MSGRVATRRVRHAVRRVRHVFEYLALRPLLAVIDLLPYRVDAALVSAGASAWFVLDRRRRRTAVDNILGAGLTADAAEAARMARASFRHFGLVVLESLKSRRFLSQADRVITRRIPPEVDALLRDPEQAVILASGHLGSWELAAQAISRLKPLVGITRRMNNPLVERLVARRKPRHGFELVPKRDVDAGRFMRVLKNHKILAFMIDQHARDRALVLDFLGRPAATHTAIALLHLVTRVPIVFGVCLRTAPGRFELRAVGPITHAATGDKQADVRAILRRLNDELEAVIREAPDQYLWAHRRWRVS